MMGNLRLLFAQINRLILKPDRRTYRGTFQPTERGQVSAVYDARMAVGGFYSYSCDCGRLWRLKHRSVMCDHCGTFASFRVFSGQ